VTDLVRSDGSGRLPGWVVDALIGITVAVLVSLVITADQGGRQRPDVIAYLWAVGLGTLMLVRRRHPLIVLAVSALGLFAYYAAGYPAIGLAVPIAAALFSAAEFGHALAAVITAALVTVVSVGFRLLEGQSFSLVVGYELVGHLALMAAAIALGDSLRSRREVQAAARRLTELSARQARLDADARVHAERLAIARDLHDSVGHDASVISLHAEVGREAAGHDDEATRRALALIKGTASAMLADLRRTVSLLRNPDERQNEVVSLDDLGSVTQVATEAGFDVVTSIDAALTAADSGTSPLSPVAEAAVYRIVQEAITNVVRHSNGTRLKIRVTRDPRRRIIAEITDDGSPHSTGNADHVEEGNGIRGMRERAESLGGHLTAGFTGRGFTVRAVVPPTEEPT
jgi:signal transduction histidine kinase